MRYYTNTYTSGPGAVGTARDLAEHRERVCDMKQRTVRDPISRLLARVEIDEAGCWNWQGRRDKRGYGKFSRGRVGEGNVSTHRFAYERLVGPIPDGLHLDHLCRNPRCCNPDHLEPVTCRENLLRGDTFQARNAAKTHCPKGHPYDEANTYVSSRGMRSCRACAHERSLARNPGAVRRVRHVGPKEPKVPGVLGRRPKPTAGIVADYMAGELPSVLAVRYGVSEETVRRRVKAAGGTVRPRGGSKRRSS